MNRTNERDILQTMRNLRNAPLDPAQSRAVIASVKSQFQPASRFRFRRAVIAASAVAAVVATVIYVAWPDAPAPLPGSTPLRVVGAPAEDSKPVVVRSQRPAPPIRVPQGPYHVKPSDPSFRVTTAVATVNLVGANPANPTTQPVRQMTVGSENIPLTWEASTIFIPLNWPNLDVKSLGLASSTKLENVPDRQHAVDRLNFVREKGRAGSSFGVNTSIELETGSFEQFKHVTLTYEPLTPTTAPVEPFHGFAPQPNRER